MRHFIAYHNSEKMTLPSTALTSPYVITKKSVSNLIGVTVWLIAGEGRSPKSYFLASRFVANKCEQNKSPGTDFPNKISGTGDLYGLSIPISGTKLLALIQEHSNNFRNGFHEVRDEEIIKMLTALA